MLSTGSRSEMRGSGDSTTPISHVTHDSQDVREDSLYRSIGRKTDGRHFIPNALERGGRRRVGSGFRGFSRRTGSAARCAPSGSCVFGLNYPGTSVTT